MLKGTRHSEKSKKRISDRLKGVPCLEEKKLKISQRNKIVMSIPAIREKVMKTQFKRGHKYYGKGRTGTYKKCEVCSKEFYVPLCLSHKAFCSKKCYSIKLGERMKGRKITWNDKIREARLKQIMPWRNTYPERLLNETLLSLGLNPVLQYPLKVTLMDLAFPEKKIAIYVDGCYWHSCPVHFPNSHMKNNDEKVNKFLLENNWKVLRFWECKIKEDPLLIGNEILKEYMKCSIMSG